MDRKQFFLAVIALALPVAAADFTVNPGQSIQAAVDGAAPGDRILVQPGTYQETGRPCPSQPEVMCAVVISKDNISLLAQPLPGQPVILENAGGQDTGIAVAKQGAVGKQCQSDLFLRVNGSRIEGFLVRNFGGDGIYLLCVDNWSVTSNISVDNAEYGFFPVHCGKGRLSRNVASGSHDTGIYIGQSNDARVDNNLAHDNVSGFELENSTNIELDNNMAIHNTAGIVMFVVPGRDILLSRGNRVHDNFVYENNSLNTCLDPTDEVCAIPPGIGILAVGGDHNQIDHNHAVGNQTFGIALSDLCTANGVPVSICPALNFAAIPQFTKVNSNTAMGNGLIPKFPGQPGSDLIWSKTGKGNCWQGNQALLVSPSEFPKCP